MSESNLSAPGLAWLLAPEPVDRFVEQYFDGPSLRVERGDAAYYGGLPTLADIDEMLATHRFRAGEIRLIKGPAEDPYRPLLRSDGTVDMGVFYERFTGGATLLVRDVDRRLTAVADLCVNLALELGMTMACNLYLTPADARGFEAHYDHHGVFVLQLVGQKHWELYDRYEQNPQPPQKPKVDPARIGPVREEFDLEPGDVLFVPRGMVHRASTGDRESLHLTIGLHQFTWTDYLKCAVEAVTARNPELRGLLPAGFLAGGTLSEADQRVATEALQRFLAEVQPEEVADRLRAIHIKDLRPAADGHLAQVTTLTRIRPTTRVRRRPGHEARVYSRDGTAFIQYPGNRMKGPGFIEPTLRAIAASDGFSVSQLPGDLSDDDKVALVRRLVRDGLLQVVDE